MQFTLGLHSRKYIPNNKLTILFYHVKSLMGKKTSEKPLNNYRGGGNHKICNLPDATKDFSLIIMTNVKNLLF